MHIFKVAMFKVMSYFVELTRGILYSMKDAYAHVVPLGNMDVQAKII